MHAPHTDVPMGDVTYRVGRFPSRVGSFIAFEIGTKALPMLVGGAVKFNGMPLPIGNPMNEAEFYNVQNHCLAVCSVLNKETGAAAPVMMADLRLDPRLEYDFPTVMALTIHALKFNIEPVFSEGNPALASLKSLFQSALNSTTTPA